MRHVSLIAIAVASVASFVACTTAAPNGDPNTPAHANDGTPTVDEILRRMNERYASLRIGEVMAPLDFEETLVLNPIFDAPIASSTFDVTTGTGG